MTYRCAGCRNYFRLVPYHTFGLSRVCSPECLQSVVHRQDRRIRIVEALDDVPTEVRLTVTARDHGRCRWCGTIAGLHLHHITYRSEGVDHSPHNLIILCHDHHRAVHADKGRWQPICRAYIWNVYVVGRYCFLFDLDRSLR